MDFLIITGLSGAGKSRAADILEDLDYYCVDNMPVALMPRFAELCIATGGRYEKVALVTDVREKNGFGELLLTLDKLKEMNCNVRILYMDADVRTIVRRYKESRRPHPLAAPGTSVEDAVHRETDLLAPIRERADFIVNTSSLTLGMLQNKLFALFAENGEKREIDVTVMSISRFSPFSAKRQDMLDFLLPLYIEEGKLALTVAIGCTGGRHRSVAIASAVTDYLLAEGISAVNVNRDLDK